MCFICIAAGRESGDYSGHIGLNNNSMAYGVSTAAFSGSVYYTDALMEGISWTGGKGSAATVSYSFTFSAEGGTTFNATQQAAALQAMQAWANVANITFSQQFGGDLTFSQDNLGFGVLGLTSTFFSGDQILSSEVQIDDSINNLAVGAQGYMVLLHELGHALGLKHPGNYGLSSSGPYLPDDEDNLQNSVMSYNNSALVTSSGNPPSTPMLYDIAAMQEIYGANTSYNSGNSTYSFNGSSQAMTIWDGAGNDTVNASFYGGGGVQIDLREGEDYVTRIGQAVVLMAFGANIENAVGSIRADRITGNDLTNQLFGGNDNDTITGGAGNDTLYGGDGIADPDDGNDVMAGENGADLMFGNTGNDTMYGGIGIADAESSSDTIYGGLGADAIYGNSGNDSLYGGGSGSDPDDGDDTIAGGNGADVIFGNGGNDFIYGGGGGVDPNEGSDLIYAGFGDDTVLANGGNDTIHGGPGNDVLHGGAGDDIYVFHSSGGVDIIQFFQGAGAGSGDMIHIQSNINGSGITTAAQAAAAVTQGSDGSGVLDLGGGHQVIIWGVGTSLTADDFSII